MGQTGALKRAGISFTAAQEEVLKYGTEEEKAAMIAEVVQQNVGNMNEEFAKTDAGKIQQAKNALGDMGEEIGAILLPAVADLVSWMQDNLMPKIQQFIDFMKEHPQIAKFALAFTLIIAALGPVLVVIGSFLSIIGNIILIAPVLGAAFSLLAGPVGIVVGAIAAAIAIGVALYKNWDTIKEKASAAWNAVKAAIMKPVTEIKTRVQTNFNTLKTTLTSAWTSIKTTATSVWNSVKSAITKPIETAKSVVQKAINKIKGFFPLKIGKIFSGMKLPHFNIKGGSAPFGIGGKGTKPSISVSWYKKAMQEPYMFSNATLFGAGESGDEMLYGRNSLLNDIATAMQSVNGGGDIVVNVYGSDNMSVSELASAVEQRLIQAQKRRTQAWA
jgi:phage-related protein